MDKYKSIILVLTCVLWVLPLHATTQNTEDEAWQYAQQAVLEHLGEKDRELTVEELGMADEIAKMYRSLQNEHAQSLMQLQTTQTLPVATSTKDEALAQKLLKLKHSMHEFFLDRNFGMDYRSPLAYPSESSDKTSSPDNKALDNQTDEQVSQKDDKTDEE